MPYNEFKLTRTTPSQLRGIQESYYYDANDETLSEVLATGYFTGFPCEDGCETIVTVNASDGWANVHPDGDGGASETVNALIGDKTAQEVSNATEKVKVGLATSTDTNFAPQLPDADTSATIVADTPKTLLKEWDKLSVNLSHIGGIVEQAGDNYPDYLMITAIRPSFGTGTGIAATYVRSFFFYGDKFECRYKDVSSTIAIYVDGKRNANDIVTATNTGAIKYFSVTFPDSKLRRIDIGCYNARIGAIFTDNTDTVSPTLNPKKALVAGDSFTEGTGATAQGSGYATRLSEISGNFNLVVSGSGGTGYVATNNGRPNLETRAQTDIVDQSPDIVIIAMGINDSLDITSAVTNTVDTIQTGLPNATIVLVGSWTAGEATGQMITNTAIIESVANSKGVYFINPTGTANGDGWVTGTGNDGNLQGDGNADIFVSSDGTHPNDAGHEFHAQRLYNSLLALGIKL